MNEGINICEILKDCPIGTKLYSTLLGDVYLREVDQTNEKIVVALGTHGGCTWTFYKGGNYFPFCKVCLLFPSKDQLDWSKFKTPVKRFDPKDFKPFDKVLVKGLGCNSKVWAPCFLEEFKKFSDGSGAVVLIGFISFIWQRCIPYNDETMHLVNTEKDCPDYYKWWEDLCQK